MNLRSMRPCTGSIMRVKPQFTGCFICTGPKIQTAQIKEFNAPKNWSHRQRQKVFQNFTAPFVECLIIVIGNQNINVSYLKTAILCLYFGWIQVLVYFFNGHLISLPHTAQFDFYKDHKLTIIIQPDASRSYDNGYVLLWCNHITFVRFKWLENISAPGSNSIEDAINPLHNKMQQIAQKEFKNKRENRSV